MKYRLVSVAGTCGIHDLKDYLKLALVADLLTGTSLEKRKYNMTGEKNRYTTVEKLWKLDDETLSTPQHDEMVLWLLNKGNIIKLFSETAPPYDDVEINSEVPIRTSSGFIVGYWDIVVVWKKFVGYVMGDKRFPQYQYSYYYIEVKPKVNSFGVTLRQLKTYLEYTKSYIDSQKIYLFTPNTQFKEAFESQGINVLSPL